VSGYHVTKDTGTYADTLLAYGAAKLLERLAGDGARVVIVDRGDRYELRCGSTIEPPPSGPVLLYDYVSLAVGDGDREPGGVIHYAAEKAARDAKPRKRVSKPKRKQATARELPSDIADKIEDRQALRPELRLIALLNSIDKSLTVKRGNEVRQPPGVNDVRWVEDAVAALATGWSAARETLMASSGKETLGAVLNPHAGKGTHRVKPDRATRENIEGPTVEERLKYAGLYEHAFVRAISCGHDDRKFDVELFVPIPEDIPLHAAREVMAQLREGQVRGRGAPQAEILAVLEYARLLALHHRATAIDRLLQRGRINRVVAGVQVAYFQDLGGGKPVTGLFRLGLPGLFDLHDRADIDAYLAVVEEYTDRLARLNGTHSDHVGVLLRYREYLSSGQIRPLLYFLCEYGELVLKGHGALRPLNCANIERIVRGDMSMKLTDVVTNEGFRNLARAIRRSTITEMYWKEAKHDQRYEIRYGLGQELRRLASKPAQFLAAIAKLTQSYNEENAKVRPKVPPHRMRADITDGDLDAVVRLVSEAEDPEALALLLVGYGYAREEREEEQSTSTEVKHDA
jgi:hypothetical protein